eukprot:TRINITY_DN71335_c0_g1_i1.p1 TRINITY_DN71335_c0_g1~~TRINITY_DN71335_c0_g1_i1.p1  ORF type:complete len:477 (+),score=105.17 TRINITY_DN71335_c0_g1_i1:68-1498(+)
MSQSPGGRSISPASAVIRRVSLIDEGDPVGGPQSRGVGRRSLELGRQESPGQRSRTPPRSPASDRGPDPFTPPQPFASPVRSPSAAELTPSEAAWHRPRKGSTADLHHDGRLRSTASMFFARTGSRGSMGSDAMQQLARRGSLATRAFEQIKANREFLHGKRLKVFSLEQETEALLGIVDRRESFIRDSGFRLGAFKSNCAAALATKKAAGKILHAHKKRQEQTKRERVSRQLVHRTVMRIGAVGPRFLAAKKAACSGSAVQWMSRVRPATAGHFRRPSAGEPAAAMGPGLSHLNYAAGSARGSRPASAPAYAPGRRTAPIGAEEPGSPCSSIVSVNTDGELITPRPKSATPAGPSPARSRLLPAQAARQHRRRHFGIDPTTDSMTSVMPDNLSVLTTPINWRQLLSDQDEGHSLLARSDDKYRQMLEKYESYQALVQKRLNALLEYSRSMKFGPAEGESPPDSPATEAGADAGGD